MEPRLLKEIGRRHSVEDFLEAYGAEQWFGVRPPAPLAG